MGTGHGARRAWVGAAVGLVLGALVLGPALAPGYTLHYDMVFVPELPLGAHTLGTDGHVPRAVPNDLLVALASTVLPGWVVQKVLLLGCFVLGGAGAARLARTVPGAVAAATWWSWNPWVGERLGIGHWGYLIGFALLPWVLLAAARLRRGEPGATASLLVSLTGAALGGSTPGVLATLLALVVLLVSVPGHRIRQRPLWPVLAISLAANAAWWWPFLTASSKAADPGGAAAFAARADTPFGVVGSLLLGGGLWNDRTWFTERTTLPFALVALLAVAVLLVLALRRRDWWRDPLRLGASAAGALGLVLAGFAALPGGTALLEWLIEVVPGAGLLRDGQKFLALWVLLLAVVVAEVVDRLAAAPRPVLVAATVWPVATLPTLAWGHGGQWGSVDWPSEVTTTAERVGADGEPVAVFPWSTYRRYAWNADRVVLDPWDRLLPGRVVSSDDLPLREGSIEGEDPEAAAVARALADGSDVPDLLRELGVRHVIVQTDQPAPPGSVPDLTGEEATRVGDLAVYDLGPSTTSEPGAPATAALGLVGTGGAVALSVLLVARRWRRRGETEATARSTRA